MKEAIIGFLAGAFVTFFVIAENLDDYEKIQETEDGKTKFFLHEGVFYSPVEVNL